jgi:hypothetical protein
VDLAVRPIKGIGGYPLDLFCGTAGLIVTPQQRKGMGRIAQRAYAKTT